MDIAWICKDPYAFPKISLWGRVMKKLGVCTIGLLFLWRALSCVDNSNLVIATIGVGNSPAGIAVTPDSLFAYVANNNNDGIPNGDCVSVLDLTYNTLLTTIHDTSFNQPYTITINAAGTKAYVTNSAGSSVTIIDLATNKVIGTINGFDGPSGFAITPDGKHAYVNNYGASGGAGSGEGTTVNVVDLNTNAIVGSAITVGQAPEALAITPDGKYVYVVNYVLGAIDGGTVSIINTSNNTSQVTAISNLSGPFNIVISSNGEYAYVTNFGNNNFSPVGTTVSVIRISTNTIVDTITLGIQPCGIAITPDGSYAYVSNYSSVYNGDGFTDLVSSQGTVNVIDLQTNGVVSTIIGGLGLAPDAIAISPNSQFAYVSNYSSNSVSVISLPSPLYNVDRMMPPYNLQIGNTTTKLNQAGLL